MVTQAENDVFDAIADLVERGEYLDQIPGVPQRSTSGGGTFMRVSGGMHSRLYDRGSKEYIQAKAAGLVQPLATPPYRRASAANVREAEEELGYPLPSLLRRLYLDVANGGFGPGYGILGLRDGHGVAPEGTALQRYRLVRGWDEAPPRSLFPICDWGCAIVSLVDCSDPNATMWGFDPNPVEHASDGLFQQEMGLVEWFGLWVKGGLYQPWALQDPETGEWRGATNEETARAIHEDWDPDDV